MADFPAPRPTQNLDIELCAAWRFEQNCGGLKLTIEVILLGAMQESDRPSEGGLLSSSNRRNDRREWQTASMSIKVNIRPIICVYEQHTLLFVMLMHHLSGPY